MNHRWNHEWSLHDAASGDIERVLSCDRCGGVKTEVIDPDTGYTSKRRYRYSQDYIQVATHWKRRDYRLENVKRALAPKPRVHRKKEVSV